MNQDSGHALVLSLILLSLKVHYITYFFKGLRVISVFAHTDLKCNNCCEILMFITYLLFIQQKLKIYIWKKVLLYFVFPTNTSVLLIMHQVKYVDLEM